MVVKYVQLQVRKSRSRKLAARRQMAKEIPANPVSVSEWPGRAERQAALDAIFGLWKDRPDAPRDGLEYQLAMRAEWP